MKKTDAERAPMMMRRTPGGLAPVMACDAETLDAYSFGKDLEVVIKQRRSLPQLRRYWVALRDVCEATGAYPTKEHLHDALKLHLGYVTLLKRFDGKIERIPDSVAISAMEQPVFQVYFDQAMKALAEQFGFDPLQASDSARAA